MGMDAIHGPFKTVRAAEKNAEETIRFIASEPDGGVN
jgi:hypothetical protein